MRVLLGGASGAVGKTIIGLIEDSDGLELSETADRSSFFSDQANGDVVIDFSHPDLTLRCLEFARSRQLPIVIGTTGLTEACEEKVAEASKHVPVCVAANFSIGVTVMMELAARAAAALPESFDIEISESHHRRKQDAPSGTALALGDQVATARNQILRDSAILDRSKRRAARSDGEIGFQVSRGGDVVGEHVLRFLGNGESLEISHRATDRSIFARGALLAAERLTQRPPGRVELCDLFIEQGC
ncbi:MAG TPA: 4-hydroxy-tetrahydrodipicolinate reductase [Wenzhouxiangella sp.]|nr:4-hydroxy-tetrahydrodipicolinate reductase [Wenzhouxiangella sp.]